MSNSIDRSWLFAVHFQVCFTMSAHEVKMWPRSRCIYMYMAATFTVICHERDSGHLRHGPSRHTNGDVKDIVF